MPDRLKKHPFLSHQGPMVFWAMALFTMSSIPGYRLPGTWVFDYDKVVHFLIYVVFAWTVHRAITNQSRFRMLREHPYIATVVLVGLYGASDEIHQYFVPMRSCSLYDWIADILGSAVFAIIHAARNRLRASKAIV